jgi:hypothetical protein
MTSKQVAAVPIRSKKLGEIQDAIREMLSTSVISRLRCLISDMESSIRSRKFVRWIKQTYGSNVVFLKGRNKAYLAGKTNSCLGSPAVTNEWSLDHFQSFTCG